MNPYRSNSKHTHQANRPYTKAHTVHEHTEKSAFERYLDVLRRQPEHMQHIYAVLFAAGITILLASLLLYSEYGFWHERYQRSDSVAETISEPSLDVASKSPLDMAAIFFKDAQDQLSKVKTSSQGLLDGKDVYTQEEK